MPTGMEVASLFAVLSLDDRASGALRNARAGLDNFSQGMDRVGRNLQGFGRDLTLLTAPITAFLGTGINTAANFETALAEISARTGLVGDDLQRVSDLALQMGADTVFSAQDAANAMLQLLTSGQTAEEAMATLPAVLEAAAASGEDLGRTADQITDIMAAFQLGVEDAGSVVDALSRAAGASSADMNSLAEGFANVGGTANMFGLSVEQTAAILAIFAENGIKGAEAGTQLRSMLNNMSRDTEDVQGMWQRLGISMFDAQGRIRPLMNIMSDLSASMAGMTDEQRIEVVKTLGGAYGQLGLTALTSSISMEEMIALMGNSASASDVAAARMGTFGGAMESLRGSVETLQIQALTPFMEQVLTPFVGRVTEVVNGITAWAQANPELTGQIITIGGALAVAGPAVIALGMAVSALSNPITAAIVLVGLLGAAYVTNFGGFRDFIDGQVRPAIDRFITDLEKIPSEFSPIIVAVGALGAVGALAALGLSPVLAVLVGIALAWVAYQSNFLGVRDTINAAYTTLKQLGFIALYIINLAATTATQIFGIIKYYLDQYWQHPLVQLMLGGVKPVTSFAGAFNGVSSRGAFGAPPPTRDSGGRGMAGQVYAITPKVGTEYFIPDSSGSFVVPGQTGGGMGDVHIGQLVLGDMGGRSDSEIRMLVREGVHDALLIAAGKKRG